MQHDFETFLQMNEKRIYFQIQRLNIHYADYDEYYTEGMLALWQAYKEFDDTKGNIGTFINYKIRFKLLDLLRKKVRTQEKDTHYIEEVKKQLTNGNHTRHTNIPLLDLTDEIIRKTYIYHEEFWKTIQSKLTENQWKWVKYFIIAELSIKEIMELENVSADAVKGWGRAVKEKLHHEEIRKMLNELSEY
ncbi:sigma-70 family RNA polymerase sigma factor [Pseudogracilibacillus sp. SO10305]|uniref:sigma-70 family RNA polymerase sigma factor n=1 Tax=Pseudogracilibacillus sp. SO10305 TaxID=3098292 RepID=UPI00300E2A56